MCDTLVIILLLISTQDVDVVLFTLEHTDNNDFFFCYIKSCHMMAYRKLNTGMCWCILFRRQLDYSSKIADQIPIV